MNKNNPKPNYFYVNRELLNSDRWLSEPFTRGQAWVDLFGLAQFKKGFYRIRGIRIDVERGQLAYSQVTLSKRWKWSRNKVRRYLKELKNNNDISTKTKHQKMDITTLITLLKYDKWQGSETPNGTPEGHQKDTKRNTYNNDKKDNNDNKGTPTQKMEHFLIITKGRDQEYLNLIGKISNKTGFSNNMVQSEINKFVNYWSELNKSGKKQRWEMEKTFEYERRLTTWMNNAIKFSKK